MQHRPDHGFFAPFDSCAPVRSLDGFRVGSSVRPSLLISVDAVKARRQGGRPPAMGGAAPLCQGDVSGGGFQGRCHSAANPSLASMVSSST